MVCLSCSLIQWMGKPFKLGGTNASLHHTLNETLILSEINDRPPIDQSDYFTIDLWTFVTGFAKTRHIALHHTLNETLITEMIDLQLTNQINLIFNLSIVT